MHPLRNTRLSLRQVPTIPCVVLRDRVDHREGL
jgi:hypothetical protein